jgi:DNA-binding Lrp family transcriptional regulator
MLTELEKKIIARIQGDIPVCERPYLEIAAKIGISEETLLETLKSLHDRGFIRRFGATLKHQKSGYTANAMTAWNVPEDRIDAVGALMAENRRVSHCYRRNPTERWPYNLYTMIHGRSEDDCREIARELSGAAGVSDYAMLFSIRELKKTSMRYFSEDDPS